MKSAKPQKFTKGVTQNQMFEHMKTILTHLDSLESLLVEKAVLLPGELAARSEKVKQDLEKLTNWQNHGEENAKVS